MSFAAPFSLDRLTAAFRALIFGELPTLRFAGLCEYSITGASSGTVNAQPTDASLGLPAPSALPVEPNVLGESATPVAGNLCLVQFVNSDPARPEVISFGPTNAAGTIDSTGTLNIGPSASTVDLGVAAAPIARSSDTCAVWFPPGTTLVITGVTIPSGAVVAATLQFSVDRAGTIPLAAIGIIGPGSTEAFA